MPPDTHVIARPDTLRGLRAGLVPGLAVALVPEPPASPWDWSGVHGKTQAAGQLAAALRRSGAVTLVAWVDASCTASLMDGYAAAAARAGLDGSGGAEAAAGRFASWLGRTSMPWLVVLDDLRELNDAAGLWPAGPAGITLITTADPAVVAGLPVRLVPVGRLSQREAVALLSERLSADLDHRAGQLDLAIALGCEPAALAHAAAVIATSELTCRQYHDLFRRRKAALDGWLGHEAPAAAVTWAMSAHHAEILEPGAGTWPMLVMASLLSPHGIPVDLLTSGPARQLLAGWDAGQAVTPERANAAVAALHEAGLLSAGRAGSLPTARMSVPLQASVRAVADPGLLGQAVAAAADALAQEWPAHEPHPAAAALLRACAATLRQAAGDALWGGGSGHRVLVAAGQSLDGAGLAGPAVAWWRQLAADCARLLGDEHADTVTATSQLAQALLAAGQPAEAVTAAGWALARRSAALGDDHPGTIKAATILGRALAAAGQPGEAAAVLAGTADRSSRALGADHAVTLAARDEHATALIAAGRPADAASLARRIVAAREESLGPRQAATLATAALLADALVAAGQLDAAVAVHEDIVSRLERVHGPDHPDALAARSRLAGAHAAAGHVSAALRHGQQVHAGTRRALGAAHRQTLASAAELARAYAGAGQITAAMALTAETIALAEKALPPADPQLEALRRAVTGITGRAAR